MAYTNLPSSSTLHALSPKFQSGQTGSARSLPFHSRPKLARSSNPWNSFTFSTPKYSTTLLRLRSETTRAVGGTEVKDDSDGGDAPIGEDSAVFKLGEQKLASWVYFTFILGAVFFALDALWINPSTGYGTAFISAVSDISESPEVVVLILVLIFAVVHSGLASLRDTCEKLIGERAYRVLFAGVSLPLALSSIMVGQVIWCLAHTIWIGNSVAVAASIGLIGHHLFGAWNGDRRLSARYGAAFDAVRSRTSVVPFAAILDGRQRLPKDYYKEFLRLPYVAVTILTLGAYYAHPLIQSSSFGLHW
ncbi:15-cis-zeta-carotene isomerase, chloroplastic isoform X2 [Phalaenopsis equestris]|uniref:15-cis-zeta-carotene isomerase, chloroplastic isoform X2 n=1 Tax=Phalaenopsis equestris TaxID=78828 RepID=UPI0009E3A05A|nr:15-cis-zeta-carotene isomerase, chloroplastic isoform X2 [Phalaenopsis equestris]